jgi:hypothetical protein
MIQESENIKNKKITKENYKLDYYIRNGSMLKNSNSDIYKFTLRAPSFVIVKLVNIIGIEIATLVNEIKQPGSYEVKYDGLRCPAGIYYYKLFTDSPTDNANELMTLPECPEKKLRLVDTKEVLIL